MANTTLTAQFAPAASFRFTDPALLAQIYADYPGLSFSGILFGVSPLTLQTRYSGFGGVGIGVIDNPTFASYSSLPNIFTTSAAAPGKVLGVSIDPTVASDGIQTLAASYTDPNGQVFTSVTWEWQVEIQLFSVADSSSFSMQVISYTGDGVANRQITTTANLVGGVTAIWIQSVGSPPVMATSAMIAAGKFATYSTSPANTTFGVTALNSTGFTVKDSGSSTVGVNAVGVAYNAIVFHDTTGSKMAVGTYPGSSNGVTNLTQVVPSGLSTNISHLFITGRAGACMFAETDHTVSYSLESTGAVPISGVVTIGTTSFTVDATSSSTEVNDNSLTYYFIAFSIGAADAIRQFFQTYTLTKTAAATDHVTGQFTFTPGFAFARPFVAGVPTAAWRGLADTGTISHRTFDGVALPSGSINSFAAGDIGIGTGVATTGQVVYGLALSSSGSSTYYGAPYYVNEQTLTNADGTTSTIQTFVQSQTPPTTLDGVWTLVADPTPSLQWWCNATYGYSVYQLDSPGSGWVACVGPTTDNGWYLSVLGFSNQTTVVSGGLPSDPRPWLKIAAWATGATGMLGGSPGAACTLNNTMVYPASGYTVGTDYPPIRVFDGRSDKEICRLPPTTGNAIPKAVMSMLAANGTVYLTTFDSGSNSSDWAGRVFSLDTASGVLTSLGAAFTTGEMPYALCWHMGRLWCGTNNGVGTVGKVYYFRPGIDTAWTLERSISASDAVGGVDSMVSYGGKLYVGSDAAAATFAKVLQRDSAGTWTTSLTATGGTARVNNGFLQLTVYKNNLYAAYWNNDTTAVAKVQKFDGTTWTTAYTGAAGTIRPFIQLVVDNGTLYLFGGGKLLSAVVLSSIDGTTWTDLTAELPETTKTLLPMFGVVVL